jgi:hypothetical protein
MQYPPKRHRQRTAGSSVFHSLGPAVLRRYCGYTITKLALMLMYCVLLAATGCNRTSPSVPQTIPSGISWASMLSDAADLRKLATPLEVNAASRMSSSSKDPGKVMLASLAPQITGDMDHGFFTEVIDEKDGVRATLGDFDGPGAITWVWSANPVGTIGLFIDGQPTPALKMPFEEFLAGRFLPVRELYASVTSLGHNLHFPIVHATHCRFTIPASFPRQLPRKQRATDRRWQHSDAGRGRWSGAFRRMCAWRGQSE